MKSYKKRSNKKSIRRNKKNSYSTKNKKNATRKNYLARSYHYCNKCGSKCMCGSKNNCVHCFLMKGGCNCGSTINPLVGGGNSYLAYTENQKPLINSNNPQLAYTGKGGSIGDVPTGLIGNTWSPTKLPGSSNVAGDYNHYKLNTYKTDPQTSMQNAGSKRKSRQNGGFTPSNMLFQDFVNVGRNISYGLGSAYNAINGYRAPINPMPYKDQLPNTIKNVSILKY
jgi:hypothetical protein